MALQLPCRAGADLGSLLVVRPPPSLLHCRAGAGVRGVLLPVDPPLVHPSRAHPPPRAAAAAALHTRRYLVSSNPINHPRITSVECDWILSKLRDEAGLGTTSGTPSSPEPAASPRASTRSRRTRLISQQGGGTRETPWSTLLKSPPLLGQYAYNFSGNWMFYTLLTFLPQVSNPNTNPNPGCSTRC